MKSPTKQELDVLLMAVDGRNPNEAMIDGEAQVRIGVRRRACLNLQFKGYLERQHHLGPSRYKMPVLTTAGWNLIHEARAKSRVPSDDDAKKA